MENPGRKSKDLINALIEGRSYIILALLIIVFAVLEPDFINPLNLFNLVKRQGFIAVAAFSATLFITLGALDLSTGSVAALVGVSFALLMSRTFLAAWPIGIALPICVVLSVMIGAACGFVNGFITVKGGISPFLVTLATMNIFRSLAIVLATGKEITITARQFSNIFANLRLFGVVPTPVVFVIAMFAIAWYLFECNKYGYYVKAIGGNEEAARVSGINVDKIKILTYTIHGAFTGVAGLMLAALYSSGSPSAGIELSVDAIAAVILGGTAVGGGVGKIWGTLAGILILAVIINGMTLVGAMYDIQILVKGIIIILAVLLDNVINKRRRG